MGLKSKHDLVAEKLKDVPIPPAPPDPKRGLENVTLSEHGNTFELYISMVENAAAALLPDGITLADPTRWAVVTDAEGDFVALTPIQMGIEVMRRLNGETVDERCCYCHKGLHEEKGILLPQWCHCNATGNNPEGEPHHKRRCCQWPVQPC